MPAFAETSTAPAAAAATHRVDDAHATLVNAPTEGTATGAKFCPVSVERQTAPAPDGVEPTAMHTEVVAHATAAGRACTIGVAASDHDSPPSLDTSVVGPTATHALDDAHVTAVSDAPATSRNAGTAPAVAGGVVPKATIDAAQKATVTKPADLIAQPSSARHREHTISGGALGPTESIVRDPGRAATGHKGPMRRVSTLLRCRPWRTTARCSRTRAARP